jgi:hypothetical protein
MKNVENVLETIKEAIKECVNDNRNDSAVYVLSDGTVKMHCGSNNSVSYLSSSSFLIE